MGSTAANEPSLSEHNAKAANVLATNEPFTEVKDGTQKPDRPDLYVESYVPVIRHGRTVAIVEVYVDQTAEAALVKSDFTRFGFEITGLTLLALLVPGLALVMTMRRRTPSAPRPSSWPT